VEHLYDEPDTLLRGVESWAKKFNLALGGMLQSCQNCFSNGRQNGQCFGYQSRTIPRRYWMLAVSCLAAMAFVSTGYFQGRSQSCGYTTGRCERAHRLEASARYLPQHSCFVSCLNSKIGSYRR